MAWVRTSGTCAVAALVGLCSGVCAWGAPEAEGTPAPGLHESEPARPEAQDVIRQLRQSLYQAIKDGKEAARERDAAHARATRLDAERGPLLAEVEKLKALLEEQESRFVSEIDALKTALAEETSEAETAGTEISALADERILLLGQVDELRAELARLPAASVTNRDETLSEADRLLRSGALPEARRLLDGALAEAPDDVRLLNCRGIVAFRQRRHEDARDDLERAVKLEPRDAESHFNLAVLLALRPGPDLEAARRHYDAALTYGGHRDEKLERALAQ